MDSDFYWAIEYRLGLSQLHVVWNIAYIIITLLSILAYDKYFVYFVYFILQRISFQTSYLENHRSVLLFRSCNGIATKYGRLLHNQPYVTGFW